MKDPESRSWLASERQRLIAYVRTLLRETSELDAEDVVQDVLLRILERADISLPLEELGAYVYRSLRNRVIDVIRGQRQTVSLDAEASDGARLIDVLQDLGPNALESLQTTQGRELLFEALATLSEMEREMVVAHEFEGRPFKELSEIWNVPQNTLISHKARAIKKLKSYFSNMEGG